MIVTVIGVAIGIVLLVAASGVAFNQQAMAEPKSVVDDPKTMDKWFKAAGEGKAKKADHMCTKGGDIASPPPNPPGTTCTDRIE